MSFTCRFCRAVFVTFLFSLCLSASQSVMAQFAPTDFLVADPLAGKIAVYDQNLVFQRFLVTGFNGVRGLDFLPNGDVVAVGGSPLQVRQFAYLTGTQVNSFNFVANGTAPIEIKANKNPNSSAYRVYIGTEGVGDALPEYDLTGAKIRGFGSQSYSSIVVLPGDVAWAGGLAVFQSLDVFNIAGGSGTGNNIARTGTINLNNNGQSIAESMFFSELTQTVLMVDLTNNKVFERSTTGTFVRAFTPPAGTSVRYGVTRGPNGRVYATDTVNGKIVRWDANGANATSTVSTNLNSPFNIIWAGNLTAHPGPTDFIVADFNGDKIAVYDQSLVFKGYLDPLCQGASGLDFLANGNIVATCRGTGEVRQYNASGNVVGGFTSANVGSSLDLKASSSNLLYIGNQTNAIPELSLTGTETRGFGTAGNYGGVALVPGSKMWGNAQGPTVEIFDLTTGSGNNIAPTSSFNLDNGQGNAVSMMFSSATSTVLQTANLGDVYERNASTGAFVRKFLMSTVPLVNGSGYTAKLGVTRGPSGDVFVTTFHGIVASDARVVRFNGTTGAFISSSDVSGSVLGPSNIIWMGNQPAAAVADLTTTKTHVGNFTQGDTGKTYTITVTNSGTAPTTGTVTMTDTVPSGLTATGIAGTNWNCTQPAGPCSRSDALAASGSYEAITLTVNVNGNASSPQTNSATVSGGGETNLANDTANDPTTVNVAPPDLTITKSHSGKFTQGQTGATYTITVTNSGAGPTSGAVTVTDTLPSGLTATGISGTNWNCAQPSGPCTRNSVLVASGSYEAITLTVNVNGNASSPQTNTATVSGGGETNAANDTANDQTAILSPLRTAWTSAGSADTVDEDSIGKVVSEDFAVRLKNGVTGTGTMRYNITAVKGVSSFCPATQSVVNVRFRNSDNTGTHAQVKFEIHRTNILNGGNDVVFSFNSNGLGAGSAYTSASLAPNIDFDFSNFVYWIEGTVFRDEAAQFADLGAIEIYESAGNGCP